MKMQKPFPHMIAMIVLLSLVFSCKKDDGCKPASTANAGPDQSIVGNTTTLAATTPENGIGSWSIVSGDGGTITDPLNPVSAFSGTTGNTYTLKWSVTGCPSSEDDVVITFSCDPTKTANAGSDQNVNGLSTTLAGNIPSSGTGTWTIVTGAGGNFTDASSPTSGFSGTAGVTYVLRWSITCPDSHDEVQVIFNPAPSLTAIDKSTVINGEIVTITGVNISGNYNGASQVNLQKTAAPYQGNEVFLSIISRTATEIKAIAQGTNGGANGAYSIRYVKKTDANPATLLPTSLTLNIAAPDANQFFTSSTFSSSNVSKGAEASFGIKNGSLTAGDYTIKLVSYDYVTGNAIEYTASVTAITAAGYDSMDKVAFTVPASLPSGLYSVKVTYNSKTLAAGWGTYLNVN